MLDFMDSRTSTLSLISNNQSLLGRGRQKDESSNPTTCRLIFALTSGNIRCSVGAHRRGQLYPERTPEIFTEEVT